MSQKQRSKTLSPIDVLGNHSPNNIIRQGDEIRRMLDSQSIKDVEANTADELAPDSGLMYRSGNGAFVDGSFQILRLSQIDHTSGATYPLSIPAGALLDDNIVEIEITGRLLNNTGGNLSALPRIYLGPSGDEVIVTSENTLTVATSGNWRTFIYKARLQQAGCLGNNILCDDELRIGSLSLMTNSTVTEILGDVENEQSVFLRLGWSGATSYVNICWIYHSSTVKIMDGTSNDTKYWWSQPLGTKGLDTYIHSNTTTTNFGDSNVLISGESNGDAYTRRILFKCTDMQNLPTNAVIDDARIWLAVEANFSSNIRTFSVYRVLKDWVAGDGSAGSGATWNTYDGTNNWGTAGCGQAGVDYDSTALGSTSFAVTETVGTFKPFSLNPTEIKKMCDGTYPNYGFIIRVDTGSSELNDAHRFHSAETSSPGMAPKMEFTWHYEE